MYILLQVVHFILPLIAAVMLIYGIKKDNSLYTSAALWISLLTLAVHYEVSGGEILGSYFDYVNASIYSFNLFVFLFASIYILSSFDIENIILRTLNAILKTAIVAGFVILFCNLWINAYFVEQKMDGTPVLEVALPKGNHLCQHRHIFYIVNQNGGLEFLCPNEFVFLPGLGKISIIPEHVLNQLPGTILDNLLIKQKPKVQSATDRAAS